MSSGVEAKSQVGSQKWLWLALLVAFAFAVWVQWPRLSDPYAVEEDFRNAFWMHRFQDPELFQDANLAALRPRLLEFDVGSVHLSLDSASLGYSLLFHFASYFGPIILFSKLLLFPLLLISVYIIYRIGEKVRGSGTALVLSLAFVILNFASPTSISMIGGLQRSFIFPLLLALAYTLMVERYRMTTTVIIVGGLIYPVVFVLGAITYGLVLLKPAPGRRLPKVQQRHWLNLAALLLFAPMLLLPMLGDDSTTNGRTISQQTSEAEGGLLSDPRYREGGRQTLFYVFPAIGRGGLTESATNFFHIVALSLATLIIWRVRPAVLVETPDTLKMLVLASVVCFVLAWLVALLTSSFLLYFPDRYTQATLPLFLLIFAILHLDETLRLSVAWLIKQRFKFAWLTLLVTLAVSGLILLLPAKNFKFLLGEGQNRWILLLPVLLLLALNILALYRHQCREQSADPEPAVALSNRSLAVLGVICLGLSVLYVQAVQPRFFVASPEERALYRFLETLPKDAMVAGNPCDLDGVPLLAKRMILFSCERLHPDDEVVYDGWEAYYAADGQTILSFCQEYEIDYLVVNRLAFEKEVVIEERLIVEPYMSKLVPLLEQNEFALRSIPGDYYLFEVGNIFIVPCTSEVLNTKTIIARQMAVR
ncbi:MAG: hypothetical protein L0332_01045 [Chloroflexi bacterium]|nr:hypothetical protein [Chloroflexota bacterium]MCI0645237.1 hypothetical protein [Chloroflexota bacterium]MCI0725309.1 hypothetical protein [Chloroflexota bacterium]